MKQMSRKKITIIAILMLAIIVEIIAFEFSRAKGIKEIEVTIVDYSNLLPIEETTLEAVDEGESGFSILLPEALNGKIVSRYLVKQQTITDSIYAEPTVETVEKYVGEKIYLTASELDEKKISVTVEYDTLKQDAILLYNKKLVQEIGSGDSAKQIIAQGFMPIGAEIEATKASLEETDPSIAGYLSPEITLKAAYDIKIMVDNAEYEPAKYNQNVNIQITNIKDSRSKYRVIHIDEQKVEEINKVEVNQDAISFSTEEFSVYAILEDTTTMAPLKVMRVISNNGNSNEIIDIWEGDTATGIKYGQGTQANPYLITSGAELSYLAQQTNAGNTTYSTAYYKLAIDIDLNGLNWTQIGDNDSSFRGVFDGQRTYNI